jgi:hypothetical protein
MLTTMMVSVRVPVRPTPASLPSSMMLTRSRPSHTRGGSVVVVVVVEEDVLGNAAVVTDGSGATACGAPVDVDSDVFEQAEASSSRAMSPTAPGLAVVCVLDISPRVRRYRGRQSPALHQGPTAVGATSRRDPL